MRVTKVLPQGFCAGVVRALGIARQAARDYPGRKIYVYGPLVHNRHVVERLGSLGIITLDPSGWAGAELIASLEPGIILFTAHGTPAALKQRAADKGFTVIDAVCPDVLKTQTLIAEQLSKGKEVIYLGRKGHPEAGAMISLDPRRIHLVTSPQEAAAIALPRRGYLITNQTTLALPDLEDQIRILRERFPASVIVPAICKATELRQKAVLGFPETDAFVIVGDPLSNNTMQLYRLASRREGTVVRMVEDAQGLDPNDFRDCRTAAVTSGASTPPEIVDAVIAALRPLGING